MEKLKMAQVYESTHRDLKILAAKSGLSIRDYMKIIVEEEKRKELSDKNKTKESK